MSKVISTFLTGAALAIGGLVAVVAGAPFILGAAIGAAIGNAAGSAIGNAIFPGGPPPKPDQTETAIKSPRPARVSGYGRFRIHEAYMLFTTDQSGEALDVGAFHDGQIDGVERYYLGDKQVTIDGSGWVQPLADGQFGTNVVKIGVNLGLRTETGFADITAAVPDQWTSDHRGDGVTSGYMLSKPVKADKYQEVYPNGGPNQSPLSLVVRGQLCFDWRDEAQDVTDPTTWKWTESAVLHLVHYRLIRTGRQPALATDAAGYAAELATILEEKWDRYFAPTLAFWTAAANDADSPMPLKGVQTILYSAAPAGNGFVDVLTASGLTAGMSIIISATGDTSLTETKTVISVTDNGAFFTIDFTGTLANSHPQGSQINWASDSGAPATEPRYRSCLAHKHTDAHKAVQDGLLACFDGWMAPRSDGALVVYSGRFYTPTVAITPDMILSYSLQDGVEEESAINSISVTYISANHDFNSVETDPWTDEDDIEARGKLLATSLDNQVPSHSQARRLAKRAQARTMASKRGNCTLNALGRVAVGQRYVSLALVEAGTTFFSGSVEITKLRRILATGGVYIEWVAADAAVDAWNPATEEGEPAPVGNQIAAQPLDEPEITDVDVQIASTSTNARAAVQVSGPDRADLIWFMRWRVSSDTTWNEQQFNDIDAGPSVLLLTGLLPVDVSIDLEAAYGTGDGRVSPWSTLVPVTTSTAALAPDQASGFTVTPGATGIADAAWTNPTSSNLASARLFRNTTNTFGTATQVGSDIAVSGLGAPDSYHATGLTAGVRYFWLATVSTSGVQGAPVSFGPVTIA